VVAQLRINIYRAGPGVSPASPWARATPHPRATNGKKNYTIHKKLKKKKKKKFIRILPM
jgi:hypothetical protein